MGLALLALSFISAAPALAAQEDRQVIQSLVFIIEGRTTERALRGFTGLREGLLFASASELAAFLNKTRRALVDDRVFMSVEVLDEASVPREGPIEHRVTVHVVDGSKLVVLPNVSYNSNLGLLLGLQFHDDDAFGTMSDWFLDDYLVVSVGGSHDINQWDLHPRLSHLMLFGSDWTLELEFKREMLQLWDGVIEVAAWEDIAETASLDSRLSLGGPWYYDLQPGFMGQFGTLDHLGNGAEPKDYAGPSYRQALGLGRVDWVGNFRSGYDLRLEDFLQVSLAPSFALGNEVSASALWYFPWSIFDYYVRARAQVDSGLFPVDLGKYLRGIPDDAMSGRAAVFLDQTLGIDLGLPKRLLDVQVHPFLDLGTAMPASRAWNPAADIRVGTGADFVFFSDALPDILIRCTYGLDPTNAKPFANPEISFETTLSY